MHKNGRTYTIPEHALTALIDMIRVSGEMLVEHGIIEREMTTYQKSSLVAMFHEMATLSDNPDHNELVEKFLLL